MTPATSGTKTIPMIGPNGEIGDVPLSGMPDALRSGFQIGIDVRDPATGRRGTVPQSRYKDALSGGMVPDSQGPSVPVPAALQGQPQKSVAQQALDMLNYPLMSKFSPTYQQDRQTDETLAHGPTTQYEHDHPTLGYVRRKLAQGALMAEDAITPGTVATAVFTGGARMLGNLPGAAGVMARGAQIANKTLSGVYGAQSLKSGYDAATNDQLSTTDRIAGAGMGLAGGVLGAVDLGAGKPLAEPLQTSAEKTYSKFLNPTTRDMKAATQQVVPDLLDRGVRATSLDSLSSRAQTQLDALGQQIDAHASAIPSDVRPDMSTILQKMKDFQDGFSVGGQVVNQAGHDSAQRVIDMLNQFGGSDSERTLGAVRTPSFQEMRGVRQILDDNVAQSGGYLGKDLNDASTLNAQKTAADAIRGELARQSPQLAALNREYNFWSNVRDVADASADRKVGQKGFMRTLFPTIAASAGYAHGGALGGLESAVPVALAATYTTPLAQTIRANLKSGTGAAFGRADVGSYGRMLQRSLAGDVSRYGGESQ